MSANDTLNKYDKALRYYIVEKWCYFECYDTVNDWIGMGYTPYGDLIVDRFLMFKKYIQVMVKYERP